MEGQAVNVKVEDANLQVGDTFIHEGVTRTVTEPPIMGEASGDEVYFVYTDNFGDGRAALPLVQGTVITLV